MTKGYTQNEGENYFDTYSPVTHLMTIHVLFSWVASHSLIIHHVDVNITFLNGELEEETTWIILMIL